MFIFAPVKVKLVSKSLWRLVIMGYHICYYLRQESKTLSQFNDLKNICNIYSYFMAFHWINMLRNWAGLYTDVYAMVATMY